MSLMRFALMSEPQQGMTYAENLALARTAEDAGFGTTFARTITPASRARACQPPTPGATLAGLARETTRSAWARSCRR